MPSWVSSFFFSSRRRHTRCYRDWSSDVCSSDLSRGPRYEGAGCGLGSSECSGGSCTDRKSTRLNSSHGSISYAVFCLKKNPLSPPDEGRTLGEPVDRTRVCVSCRFVSPPAILAGKFDFFFFNDTATTEIYTLSLHDALPIFRRAGGSTNQLTRVLQSPQR